MPHPTLTSAQTERLEMLIEEASEVIKASTKILRNGYLSGHLKKPHKNNRDDLHREVAEFLTIWHKIMLNNDTGMKFFIEEAQSDRIWAQKIPHTYHQKPLP